MNDRTTFKRLRVFESAHRADESFRVIQIDQSFSGCSWHFHPELQLCHVKTGSGTRVIGDRVCPIERGEVVLLGSNLPHVWRYDEDSDAISATVVHFEESALGTDFLNKPEMRELRLLFARAGLGLQAFGDTRLAVAENISGLANLSGFSRVLALLDILHRLAGCREVKSISGSGFQPVASHIDAERLRCACDYIRENCQSSIDRDTVARVLHMSPSGFSRFFKTHTGMTFQDFVSDVRISRACERLVDGGQSITEIAYASGFADVSTFNRAFKKFRDMTPSDYRRAIGDATQK